MAKDDDSVYLIGADYGDKQLQWGEQGPYLARLQSDALTPKPRESSSASTPKDAPKARPLTYEEMVRQLQKSVESQRPSGPSTAERLQSQRDQSEPDYRKLASQALTRVRPEPQQPKGPSPEELSAEADRMMGLLSLRDQPTVEATDRQMSVNTQNLDQSAAKQDKSALDTDMYEVYDAD